MNDMFKSTCHKLIHITHTDLYKTWGFDKNDF